MSVAATFLGGAKSRLLPVSVPFRFFAAAAVFHVLAWLALLWGAGDLVWYRGGLGFPLGALHLLTLGTLTMTGIGAAFQLLPVATVQPLTRVWPAQASFWLGVPGVAVLAFAMAAAQPTALVAGAVATTLALAIFAVAIADNLRRARSMPLVAAHGWAALGALVGLVLVAALLILNMQHAVLPDHAAGAFAHFVLAAFGFMGLLALGFSYVLVPMFALSRAPPARPAWASLAFAVAAIGLACAGALMSLRPALAGAAALGLIAAGLHLQVMAWVWKRRMRKRMGLSFVLVRLAWAMLVISLMLGLALALGAPVPQGDVVFVFLVLVGWLLTFLTGILQRILPFLATMHAGKVGGKQPLLSDLAPELPLKIHAACHVAAVVFIPAGLVLELSPLIHAGAAFGTGGSIAFGAFTFTVIRRMAVSRIPDQARSP
jgi:hypothetical protein